MTEVDGRRHRKWSLATIGAATVVVVAAGWMGVAQAVDAPLGLSFTATATNVTAERTGGLLALDLGVNLIAGSDPFEIRATRASYATPIVAEQVVGNTRVKLPAGMVTDFGGLKRFTTTTFKNSAGKIVQNVESDFCPNTSESTRTRLDAPAHSPYPTDCAADNPFTLGAVWGIQAGWNASVPSNQDPNRDSFDLPAGKYAVTVKLNPAYQEFFKIPKSKATIQLSLTVVNITDDGGKGVRASGLKAQHTGVNTAHDRHSHAAEGDESAQISAYLPQFRPSARRPVAVGSAPTGPRPDLRSLPAWDISLEQGSNEKTDRPNGKWYINFGATVWNAGTSPLLVDGFRRTGSELMDAYQYFFDTAGNQVGAVQAGTMQWDPREGHMHWHFTDFAQYNLLGADKKLAVRSGKEAFCLANTDAVDYTVPNAQWRPDNTDLSTACGNNSAVAVREELDIGGGDTYSQDRPGQSFEVTGLPNGVYYIQVKANPQNKLSELSTANNSSLRRIVLGGSKAHRTLHVPSVNGIKG